MTDPRGVRLERDGERAEIVLDRPAVLNAFDDAMVGAFHAVLDELDATPARCVVVRGEGRAFSAGRDLSDADPLHEDAHAILAEVFNPMIRRLAVLGVPTIAAVHGACLGVGFGVAMACDLVVCAERSRIGSPFANIGCVLDSGGHAALVHRVGPHRALELIYTGRLIDGHEAAAIGLVNRCVPDDDLLGEVRGLADAIAAGPTAAFARSKRLVRDLLDGATLDEAMEAEAVAQGELAGTPDYVEGMTAFLEKRRPRFTGR
ncbi:MAG: enoyl-CoA hydratase/isomerase family protein [Actinomyces sp.]|nr:MAG: enoyl-CoA hydratase/isomerase family protein [Actinomyces sp.]